MGWESGLNTRWKDARAFYSIMLLSIIVPSLIVLLPKISLIKIMLWSQGMNGMLLPVILIFVMLIVNNRRIMGEYINKKIGNIIGWTTISAIILATIVLVFSPLLKL